MKTIEIKKWLLDKGLKQKDISDQAGVHTCTVTYFIKGERNCDRVRKVFQKLGCPAEFLKKKAA